ncbi:alpha-ketoglutarate-dependent dioxygenase AlkB family protein [Aequorivita sediminis]|uniref:alpha-ketoglutarate-dependent dioxygenase AlkB family protein n=1 Tax=Aequorivita sediminis TaxID=3073653 RepID=UPI0028A86A2A|nr:alpha-ketoglutarate-dependent dioxygenase AlkB [Aequorivita sp. F6058]
MQQLNLFSLKADSEKNLLPKDGEVNYLGRIFSKEVANRYFEILLNSIFWKNDEAFIFGKKIITKRKVAWYGDKEFNYTYSKTTKKALPWTPELLELKNYIEKESGETYNSCLLNLYHTGAEGMAWHSDDEKDLKKNGAIASVSFGAARKFAFKHKETKETISVNLEHGSLLVMKGEIQTYWLHRLPPTKKIHSARINLTFRTIID